MQLCEGRFVELKGNFEAIFESLCKDGDDGNCHILRYAKDDDDVGFRWGIWFGGVCECVGVKVGKYAGLVVWTHEGVFSVVPILMWDYEDSEGFRVGVCGHAGQVYFFKCSLGDWGCARHAPNYWCEYAFLEHLRLRLRGTGVVVVL